jgi:uncharacterized protein
MILRRFLLCLLVLSLFSAAATAAMGNRVKDLSPNEFFQGAQLQLAEAIHALDVDSVKRLARQTDLNTPARKDMTLLFFAFMKAIPKRDPKELAIVTALVAAGADAVEYRDKDLGSVWGLSMTRPEPELARALLDGGVSVDSPGKGKGSRPGIFECANERSPLVMQLLIERGVNLNGKDRLGGTLLAHTLAGMQLDQTETLLKAGANPSGNDRLGTSFGWTLQYQINRADKNGAGYKKLLEIQSLAVQKGMKWPPDAPELERDRMRARGETPVVPAGQTK